MIPKKSPFIVQSGSMGSIQLQIPWRDLLTGTCQLNIQDLSLNLCLKSIQDIPEDSGLSLIERWLIHL